jgi:hypothetical protein
MKQKINHNGHCLHCGKESKTPFCNRQCYRGYIKGLPNKDYEKQQRDSLSDRVVKRTIYIGGRGKIKYNQITPEMIIEKRKDILALRFKKENHLLKKDSIIKGPYKCKCSVCGIDFISKQSKSNKCSPDCANKQLLERMRVKYKHTRKAQEPFECKECGEIHQPEYGDKRSTFCSKRCSNRHARREHKKRAEQNGVFYEYVNPRKVFKRDGWRCQICKKKLNPKNRGALCDDAPELDHIIPWSQGGEHSYRNTQCACRKCNREKGGLERGQLRLFG